MRVQMIHCNDRQVRKLEVIDIGAVPLFYALFYIIVHHGV